MGDKRIPCTLTVQPWYEDHSVGGTIVLPAVESMLLLAAKCVMAHPAIDIRVMENARFGKFLELPRNAASVPIFVECNAGPDNRVQAKLLSHRQLGAMARIKEHAEIFFPAAARNMGPPAHIDPVPLVDTVKLIDSAQLYRDLVPFGRCYHTLQGNLSLSDCQAWGQLHAPELPFIDPVQNTIGSPFPCDGALHAACVLGQQFVDFPPFPVGFQRRIIFRPTQPGGNYLTKVTMTSLTADELVFDLHIFNDDGWLYETVTGIHMRDVSKAVQKRAGE